MSKKTYIREVKRQFARFLLDNVYLKDDYGFMSDEFYIELFSELREMVDTQLGRWKEEV